MSCKQFLIFFYINSKQPMRSAWKPLVKNKAPTSNPIKRLFFPKLISTIPGFFLWSNIICDNEIYIIWHIIYFNDYFIPFRLKQDLFAQAIHKYRVEFKKWTYSMYDLTCGNYLIYIETLFFLKILGIFSKNLSYASS